MHLSSSDNRNGSEKNTDRQLINNSLSQKNLVAQFMEYVSNKEMKNSSRSSDKNKVLNDLLIKNRNTRLKKSSYNLDVLKSIEN